MNLKRCKNGHFYDADRYDSCPHCGEVENRSQPNETVAFSQASGQDQVTVSLDQGNVNPASVSAVRPGSQNILSDEGKTVSFYDAQMGKEPVVGWLVCTKGNKIGEEFRLKSGRNFIGRGSNMDVHLENEKSVSRDKHAVVIYEPKANIFLAQPGESTELFYLNGEVVLSPVEIHKNDRLEIGDIELMLIPCCDESFSWSVNEENSSDR